MNNWKTCQSTLGVFFQDASLLGQALTHSSYLNEDPGFPLPCNERLEFLGDAVLNFVIGEQLYREFPRLTEGDLTAMRASLVCHKTLAQIASSLNLGHYLLLGHGEEANRGRERQSNLENALEAVIGAIFLDQGIDRTREFIISQFGPVMTKLEKGKIIFNYKKYLQELAQSKGLASPTYRVLKASGPDHDRQFVIEVFVKDRALGQGTGKNKKEAEMAAARSAWEIIMNEEDSIGLFPKNTN
jgi:ribonuclease-3